MIKITGGIINEETANREIELIRENMNTFFPAIRRAYARILAEEIKNHPEGEPFRIEAISQNVLDIMAGNETFACTDGPHWVFSFGGLRGDDYKMFKKINYYASMEWAIRSALGCGPILSYRFSDLDEG